MIQPLRLRECRYPGLLITFCGLDGCGKSTMLARLEKQLWACGITPEITRQPTGAVRESDIFRTYMDSPDVSAYDYRSLSLLAASDRVQHSNKYILPLLLAGKVVLSDRYFYSCLANLRARGFHEDEWIYEVSGFIPRPDLAVLIDVDAGRAIGRVKSREEEKDRWIDRPLHYALREEYLAIFRAEQGLILSSETGEEETFSLLWSAVREKLGEKGLFTNGKGEAT